METGKPKLVVNRALQITSRLAHENIAVDGVGVGVGVIDGGKTAVLKFAVFKSGFAPDPFLTFGDEPKRREMSVHRS